MTDVPVSQEAREARIARYLSNEKEARESLATYPESTRQRLKAWQTEQCEWFSDTILEIVAEFITIDDAIRQQAERDVIARMEPVAWLYDGPYGRSVHEERAACAPLLGGDWTETPLYALPTPPAGEA